MIPFNNTVDGDGHIQHAENNTGLGKGAISGDSDMLKLFTGYANDAVSDAHIIILKADGRMQFDDPDHIDAPVSEANLVLGQKKYGVFEALPTVSQDWLEVESVEILDENDNGIKLRPVDIQDIQAESEFLNVNGTPRYFDFDGAEVKLYPAPNYGKVKGFIVFFKRAPLYFMYTDTTKVAGFNSNFHKLIHKKMTLAWGNKIGLSYVPRLEREIEKLEKELALAYGRRNKSDRIKITRRKQNYR